MSAPDCFTPLTYGVRLPDGRIVDGFEAADDAFFYAEAHAGLVVVLTWSYA